MTWRALDIALVAVLFAALAAVLVTVDSDPDIWGRLAYARDAWAAGVPFLRADPYSYTAPGAPWVSHEWGFSWIAYGTYRLSGWFGLRLLRVTLMASAVVLGIASGGRGPRGWQALGGALSSIALATGFVGPRAEGLTFGVFAWMLFCFERSRERGGAWVFAAVLPFPLWINLHGGYLAGLGAALGWCAVRGAELRVARRAREGTWVLASVAWAVASAFTSLWGPRYLVFLVRTALMQRPLIAEWSPPAAASLLGASWTVLVLVGLWAAVALRLRPWASFATWAAVAAAAARHQRHLPFLALATWILLWPRLGEWLERRKAAPASSHASPAARAAAFAATALAIALSVAAVLRARGPEPSEPNVPAAATRFIAASGFSGGLLVDFNWAQYALWRLSPRVKVAFDGRYEELYPEEVQQQFFRWHEGAPGWRALPSRQDTGLALVASGSDRARWLAGLPGWQRVYTDGFADILQKAQ